MNQNENECMTNNSFHNFNQLTTSPQSRRNTKNLSLKLGSSNSNTQKEVLPIQSPIPSLNMKSTTGVRSISASPITSNFGNTDTVSGNSSSDPSSQQTNNPPRLFRHPSLSISKAANNIESNSSLRRRRTLTLSIPTHHQQSDTTSKTSAKLSSNSIPSISSSSPITSSPIVPSTPLDFSNVSMNPLSKRSNSTTSSNKTIQESSTHNDSSSNILRTQTLIQNLSSIDLSGEGDTDKINVYPNGPVCVLEPNLYLYSEPTAVQLKPFKLIINVAKELTTPLLLDQRELITKTKISNTKIRTEENEESQYVFVPWTHTSKLCADLPMLTDLIMSSLNRGEKVLIHCQCGVSRSASLIVALFMKLKRLNLNDAYNLLKDKAPDISPNMSLIFQLMEWGEIIGVNDTNVSNNYDLCDSPISLQHETQHQHQSQSQETDKESADIHIHNDPLVSFQ